MDLVYIPSYQSHAGGAQHAEYFVRPNQQRLYNIYNRMDGVQSWIFVYRKPGNCIIIRQMQRTYETSTCMTLFVLSHSENENRVNNKISDFIRLTRCVCVWRCSWTVRRPTSLPMMAGRGTGDGRSSPYSGVRSPSSSSAGGEPDWPLLGADQHEDIDEATDYRRRCVLLETSLVKFKEKATRVRQLFTVKVSVCVLLYRVGRRAQHV